MKNGICGWCSWACLLIFWAMLGCSDDEATDAGGSVDDVADAEVDPPVYMGPDQDVAEATDDDLAPEVEDEVDVVQYASIEVLFNPSESSFYSIPWPFDLRMDSDGFLDLSDFPGQDAPMMDLYLEVAQSLEGFSTNPVVYFGFDELPTEASIPSVTDTMTPQGHIQLFDVSAGGCGQRVPVEVKLIDTEDQFVDELLLAVAPVPGFVLRPSTPYGLVVLRSFGMADELQTAVPEAFEGVLDGSSGLTDLVDVYAPLAECLEGAGLSPEQIAVATVFTTQETIDELVRMRAVAIDQDTADPVIANWQASGAWPEDEIVTFSGTYETPIFQEGESPYNVGGGLELDESGVPIIQRWEEVPFFISMQDTAEVPIPVVIWEDGTGANAANHATDDWVEAMLEAGFAVATFDPQFHGQRNTVEANPILHTFNYTNPESGRTVYRQQVTDTAYFIRLLRDELDDAAGLPELSTETFVFAGQSQGAHVGAMAAGVETEIAAFSLNGVGGYFSTTIIERKDPVDINGLLQVAFELDEPLDRFHPVAAIAQLNGEVVDPINFAGRWRGWEADPTGANIFITNGMLDHAVPTGTVNALTIAGNIPLISGSGWDVDPLDLWDVEPEDLPIADNATAVDGSDLTIATFLDAEGDHYTVYDNADAQALSVQFLESASSGAARLEL